VAVLLSISFVLMYVLLSVIVIFPAAKYITCYKKWTITFSASPLIVTISLSLAIRGTVTSSVALIAFFYLLGVPFWICRHSICSHIYVFSRIKIILYYLCLFETFAYVYGFSPIKSYMYNIGKNMQKCNKNMIPLLKKSKLSNKKSEKTYKKWN